MNRICRRPLSARRGSKRSGSHNRAAPRCGLNSCGPVGQIAIARPGGEFEPQNGVLSAEVTGEPAMVD
jgi:hypothetical protein